MGKSKALEKGGNDARDVRSEAIKTVIASVKAVKLYAWEEQSDAAPVAVSRALKEPAGTSS